MRSRFQRCVSFSQDCPRRWVQAISKKWLWYMSHDAYFVAIVNRLWWKLQLRAFCPLRSTSYSTVAPRWMIHQGISSRQPRQQGLLLDVAVLTFGVKIPAGASPSCFPRGHTRLQHREASMRPWETCQRTTGGGMHTTRSRDQTGWEIRSPLSPWSICHLTGHVLQIHI